MVVPRPVAFRNPRRVTSMGPPLDGIPVTLEDADANSIPRRGSCQEKERIGVADVDRFGTAAAARPRRPPGGGARGLGAGVASSGPMRLVNPIAARWLEDGRTDPEAFWDRAARRLHWFRPWDRTFVWDRPTFRWFEGGRTNLAWNALDRHVADGCGGHAALAAANERGERRVFTYAQLLSQVQRVA